MSQPLPIHRTAIVIGSQDYKEADRLVRLLTPENGRTCLVTGNINESIDVFNRNVVLPEVSEGAILALLNAGGYGSSMQSHHCLRALPTEMLLD